MTNAPDFRHSARTALERARAELASNEPYRFRYAALELRDAMEALTYDRAMAYKNDIPPEDYYTWQPRKLMMVLLGVDPDIGKSSTLAIGIGLNTANLSLPSRCLHSVRMIMCWAWPTSRHTTMLWGPTFICHR